MLALSIVTPHGTNIASGKKTLEVRSWCPPSLPVRDLLIVENTVFLSRDMPCDPDGRVVAIVDIEEVHEWRSDEVAAACSSGWEPGYWAWHLANVRPIVDGPIMPARRKLYEIDPPSLTAGMSYQVTDHAEPHISFIEQGTRIFIVD
ncbi:UNVERIFIED_CONTAM: ASCH domain-containing protein [Aeromonas hydrophila]